MYKRAVAIAAGVLLMLALAAGCGSGSDDSSLSKSEFIQEADAICQRQEESKNKALIAGFRKLGKEGDESKKAQEGLITDVALPPIKQMTEELADLGAPSGEEEKVDAMVEAFEEEVQKIEDDPAGTVSGKNGSFSDANKLAKELNLKACSKI